MSVFATNWKRRRKNSRRKRGYREEFTLVRITEILKEEGFIKNFRLIEDKKQGTLRVYLKYGPGNEKIISGLVRVSKPGRRVYVAKDKIPSILGGMGVAILSTSRGVMTDRAVRKQQLGGEVLAYVW